jgi:hypothetical protein
MDEREQKKSRASRSELYAVSKSAPSCTWYDKHKRRGRGWGAGGREAQEGERGMGARRERVG